MAITYTPKLGLAKPAHGDVDWHIPVNGNWDKIDTELDKALKISETYSIPCLIAAGRHPDTNLYLGGGGWNGIVATVPASITDGYAAGTLHTVWIQYEQKIRADHSSSGGTFRSSVLVNGNIVAKHTVSVTSPNSSLSDIVGFLLTIKTGDVITVRAEDYTGDDGVYPEIGQVSVSAFRSRRWIQ
jgi:hypothetical protein